MKKKLESPINLAAIDIGSNAARLVVKELSLDAEGSPILRKQLFLRFPLRLGIDVYSFGSVSEYKTKQMVQMLEAFRHLMKAYDVKEYRACATSALRDAENRRKVLRESERKSGLQIDLISGEEESALVYGNHENLSRMRGNCLFVDVGGGSTETSLVINGIKVAGASYKIGTIRLIEGAETKPEFERMETELSELTRGCEGMTIVGSGGNINKIYRILSKERKDDDWLTVEQLGKFYRKAIRMSIPERMEKFGIKADRADVVVPAASIFLSIAKIVSAKRILVPGLGLADGIIGELARHYV